MVKLIEKKSFSPTHVLFTKLEERKIVLILFVPVYVSQTGSALTVFPCNNVKCQQQQIYVTFYVWKQHFSNTFLARREELFSLDIGQTQHTMTQQMRYM